MTFGKRSGFQLRQRVLNVPQTSSHESFEYLSTTLERPSLREASKSPSMSIETSSDSDSTCLHGFTMVNRRSSESSMSTEELAQGGNERHKYRPMQA
jgi:hypothetical protein